MGLGLAPLTPSLPSWENKQSPWWERQPAPAWERKGQMYDTRPVNNGHSGKRGYYNNGPVYVAPYGYFPYAYGGSSYYVSTAPVEVAVAPPYEAPPRYEPPPPAPEPPPPPMGVLRLEIEPRADVQIFVDGVYVGTPADLGSDIGLAPGVRNIELRARGYKTVSFSAEIIQNRSITYRATLERDPNAPAPPAVIIKTAGARTMYVIPGCYLGNVEPTQSALRPGCDISKLSKFEP